MLRSSAVKLLCVVLLLGSCFQLTFTALGHLFISDSSLHENTITNPDLPLEEGNPELPGHPPPEGDPDPSKLLAPERHTLLAEAPFTRASFLTVTALLKLSWTVYLRWLNAWPIVTKALTSGILAALSDMIAQRISGAKYLEVRRAVLMGLYGFVYVGPTAHFVHVVLDHIFDGKQDIHTAVKKVAMEQASYGPFCNVMAISYIAAIVEGRSWSQTKGRLLTTLPAVQRSSWRLWPLVALINHKFIALQFRVLFVNIVSVFWSTFLILRARSSDRKLRLD